MRLRSLSVDHNARRKTVSGRLNLTRTEEGFKNFLDTEDRRSLTVIDNYIETAKQLARRHWGTMKRFRRVGFILITQESIDDAAYGACLAYYALSERERPRDLVMIQDFLFRKVRSGLDKIVANLQADRDFFSKIPFSEIIEPCSVQAAGQELHISAVECLNAISQLPKKLISMAMKMVDGATLPEAAIELDLDLFDAMNLQKEIRVIIPRIIEGGAVRAIVSPTEAKKIPRTIRPSIPQPRAARTEARLTLMAEAMVRAEKKARKNTARKAINKMRLQEMVASRKHDYRSVAN